MWIAPYGLPEVIISDGGSEFKAFFERCAEQAGILQVTSDASSPWQNGKVERHGGWVKSRAEAEIDAGQSILTSVGDLDDLVLNIVVHKNRWFSRGGFSPAQLAFGANPRIPADLLSEDPLQGPGWDDIHLDPYDQDTPAAEFSRAHLIRQRARELCIAQNSKDKIRLSGKGKRHPQRTWSQGQWVFVWRRTPGIPSGHITRLRWTGPGIVVLQQSHTVWVSMRSRLLKCNSDQLRPATHYEELGADLSESQELQDLLKQVRSGRAGAVDVASEGSPEDEAFSESVPHGTGPEVQVQDQGNSLETIPKEADLRPINPGVGHSLRDLGSVSTSGQQPEDVQDIDVSTGDRRRSIAEPEPVPSIVSEGSDESKRRRLDVTPVSSNTPRSETSGQKRTSELARLEKQAIKELRRLDRIDRAHARSSAAASTAAAQPVSETETIEEVARSSDSLFCFFETCAAVTSDSSGSFFLKPVKSRNSEFNLKEANIEERIGFEHSDKAEWENILQLGAAKVLSPEAAREIKKHSPDRVVTSRMIRRKKPQPGVNNFKFKSRWCIHGHVDPDTGSFKTFAPMPSSEAIIMFFQIALNLNFRISFADVQQAFCQSDDLDRPQGKIFVVPCPGLGLPNDSLIELIKPVYGLDDAPLRWHKTLLRFFNELGFERSLLEPCWLVKRVNGSIQAMVLIEVDDINVACVEGYKQQLQSAMTKRFQFGKWEHDQADFAGRSVIFEKDRVVMHQQKYILEKLETVKLPKHIKADHQALLEGAEFESYRSMLYRVNWLAHQTRPEASGIVSILSSRLHRASVHDVRCLNKLVSHIKGTASQPLVLHKMDSNKMVFVAASDAGGVAAKLPTSEAPGEDLLDPIQGAWVVLVAERVPAANVSTKVSILSWRSAELKRRCSSTLASEALALDQALGELEWLQIMFRDVVFNDVSRSNWQQSILPFQAVSREDCELRDRLQQCTITDAKSLFDAITKDNPASRQDRRTATEIAIILESIRRSSSVTRWSPHPKMIADVLTKDDISKSNGALEELVRTSRLRLWDESVELANRKSDPSSKNRSKRASSMLRLREQSAELFLENHPTPKTRAILPTASKKKK